MGADLQEAKRVCKEDGKLFEDWCGSDECPVSPSTARRLMSVHAQLGHEKNHAGFLQHGFTVLAEVTQTRDEDIRQALLEHIAALRMVPSLLNPAFLAMMSRDSPVDPTAK